MGDYEKDVLADYGLNRFLYVPSVYGKSNFSFDEAGAGIRVDSSKSDFFHSITDQMLQETKKKRAVIVFFKNKQLMDEYTTSAYYRQLGRQTALLKEDMDAAHKDFTISKAATTGQKTISTAVFGRGTDFFCKDDRVQNAGGVHVIQTFFSEQESEQIQIQGRTARQGKKGTYQIILLESDIAEQFGIGAGKIAAWAKEDLYSNLCAAREKLHERRCRDVDLNLVEATKADNETHRYFDALLAGDIKSGYQQFKSLYDSFKRKLMPSEMNIDIAFGVDQTGSMAPYTKSAMETLKAIVDGPTSITKNLEAQFPDITFRIRVAVLGYRDVGDQNNQFVENVWDTDHFTDNISTAVRSIERTLANPSGGDDIAEDHLGAIHRCTNWNSKDDWSSEVKFLMLLTDAPAPRYAPTKLCWCGER